MLTSWNRLVKALISPFASVSSIRALTELARCTILKHSAKQVHLFSYGDIVLSESSVRLDRLPARSLKRPVA